MELGGTQEPEPAPAARTTPQEDSWEEQVRKQREMLNPAPKPKPTPQSQPPKQGLASVLGNPRLPPESKQVLQKLDEKTPFTVDAEKYGKAIAESIMLQSQATMSATLNFEDEMRKRVELKGGSYAIIYKGSLPVRVAPFMWQLDQGTRRQWACFSFNNFYGHKDPHPLQFWKKFRKILVLTPFDSGTKMVENFGKGYWVKFDEGSQFQMPINILDTEETEKMRIDNKHFISAALTLWMDLQEYTKPKINMKLIMYLIIAAGIVVFLFWFFKSHPGFLSVLHI